MHDLTRDGFAAIAGAGVSTADFVAAAPAIRGALRGYAHPNCRCAVLPAAQQEPQPATARWVDHVGVLRRFLARYGRL